MHLAPVRTPACCGHHGLHVEARRGESQCARPGEHLAKGVAAPLLSLPDLRHDVANLRPDGMSGAMSGAAGRSSGVGTALQHATGAGLGCTAMGRLIRRRGPRATATVTAVGGSLTPALRGVAGCSAFLVFVSGAQARTLLPPSGGSGGVPAMSAAEIARDAGTFRQIILPDLLIVAPAGLTDQHLAALNKITGVRNMIAFDGAQIDVGNRAVNVIGVNPATFRSWVPLQTASNQAFWTALASGKFLASPAAYSRLGLRRGDSYQPTGRTRQAGAFRAAASLGP